VKQDLLITPICMHPHRLTRSKTKPSATAPQVTISSPSSIPPTTTKASAMLQDNDHKTPLHLPDHDPVAPAPEQPAVPNIPPVDPQLQATRMAMVKFMTRQFQAQQVAPEPRRQRCTHNCDDDPAPQTCIKTRDPNTYDGNDPTKLHAFISQCKLVFCAHPEDFDDDEVKITYTVSWLKGTAQCWYEPTLALEDHQLPKYALHWDAFKEALKTTFREPDPVNSAMHKLDNLCMQDHHHITKYNIEFNEYATITGFDKRALFAKYYKGLAPCIKDSLVYSSQPDTLAALRTHAMNLELRYWERKDEDKYHTTSISSSSSKPSTGSSSAMSSNTP